VNAFEILRSALTESKKNVFKGKKFVTPVAVILVLNTGSGHSISCNSL